MSYITAIIVVAAPGENMGYLPGEGTYNELYWLDQVNTYFADNGRGALMAPCNRESGPGSWGAGLQCEMAQVSTKGVGIPEFLEHLRKLPWERPERVQVFILDEYDERWSLYNYPFVKTASRLGS